MKVWSNLYKHGEGSEKLEKVLFYLVLSGEDFHTALNPVLVPRAFVRILTVMAGPVLVKGPGMELPHNFSV